MASSYANRWKCQSAEKRRSRGAGRIAIFIAFVALGALGAPGIVTVAASDQAQDTPAPGKPISRVVDDHRAVQAGPAGQPGKSGAPAPASPAALQTPQAPLGPGAEKSADGDKKDPPESSTAAAWAWTQFSTPDGMYVLDTRSGTVSVVTAQGRAYSFAFTPGQNAAAAPGAAAGRFQGSLVQGHLFVLDRQTGALVRVSLADLTQKIVLQSDGTASTQGNPPAAGGTNSNQTAPSAQPLQPILPPLPSLPNGGDHRPPATVYTNVQAPETVSEEDRKKAERDIGDYSYAIGYPYIGKPSNGAYEIELAIENRGKRQLAALETTLEYLDPKTGKTVQQRLYFRRDNGPTNAPPAPGKAQSVTIRLPSFDNQPGIRVVTSYILFAD